MTYPTRKKVLYLITKSNWGGAQRYVYDLATTLDRSRFEPVVALGGDGILKEMLEHAHVRTITITSLERDISLKKELAFTKELYSILRNEKPDVFHVNSSKAGAVGTLIGRIAQVPRIIFTAHGWAFNEARPWWQKIIITCIHWFTVMLSHKTIAVSNAIVHQLRWPGVQKRFIVINPGRTIGPMYNRVEAREILATRHPILAPHKNRLWIMTIAELHPIKRLDVLINAMPHVRKHHPKAIAVIIGDGELRELLQNRINEVEASDYIFLVGAITEAARFLKAADVFTLTSDSESYGYVVHEAGNAKVPIVATEVGGIIDIVDKDVNGILIQPGNVGALSDALIETLVEIDIAKQRADKLHTKLQTRTKEAMTLATSAVYELSLK